MGRTNYNVSTPGFVADPTSIDRTGGVQIDWANVAAGYVDANNGKKVLKAGTAVGTALSGNGSASPRVVTTNPAVGLLATDAVEDDPAAPLSGYGLIVGGVVFEPLLPDATGGPPKTLPAAIKTELESAGTGFAFLPYSDAR
jgi:hypothetical protein